MTGNRSIFRFLMTLVFAALIASPQPMVASELSDNAGSEGSTEVTSTPSDDNTGDNPGDPGGDDTTGGDGTTEGQAPEGEGTEGETPDGQTPEDEGTEGESPEGQAPEGEGTEGETPDGQTPEDEGTEGETPDGQTPEDEGTEGEGAEGEGTEAQGPEKTNTDDDAKSIAPANIGGDFSAQQVPDGMTPQEWYCDFRNQPSQGSVADWWAAEGVTPDCIDFLVVVNNEECSLTVTMSSWVYSSVSGNPFTWNDSFAWYETDSNGVVLRPEGGGPPLNWQSVGSVSPDGKSLTATFPEDHNGGTAYVLVNFGSPERDIQPGLSDYDKVHWRTTAGPALGGHYEVNTDCELPPEGFFCDYANHTGAGDVFSWLESAPEGANTDCIDVGSPVQVCGSLDIPFESRVLGYNSEFLLTWAVGTEIPADDSQWNTTWPITFPEDYNGGSVDVIVFIQGPEDDYYHFAGEDPYPYPYPNQDRGDIPARSLGGGVQFTIDTDCIPNIPDPGLPTPIDPAVCQVSYAGYTKFEVGSGVTDRVKVGGDANGEINGDGWASTMRLYGATRDDLSNVTMTWTMVGGGNFGDLDGTVSNPGAGALAGAGYTVPVVDPVISPAGNTITVTIGSMPANSSFSFNVGVVPAEGQTAMYVHSWMLGDLTDCEPAVLALPTITASVCDDAFQPTPIVVTEPDDSESVSYSDVTAVSGPEGLTFTITATVNDGFTLDGATIPDGWTVVNSGEATYSVTLALADCEVPLEVVTPELPTLVAATCNDDNEPVLPTLTVPETDGITYSEVTSAPANSVLLSLTATANDGYTFAGATMPEGWTLVSSSEALYEIVADEAECPTEEPTVTPTEEPTGTPTAESTGTPTPEDPKEEEKKDDKAAEVKELPSTGAGSNPASMIGLAATAAAAIAAAGLFFTNRKR